MEMHNLHFILFTTLIQHLYKEKKRKNDDIYAPFIAKYIKWASDQKRETSPGHTLYRKKSPSHCSSYCSLIEKADLLPVREQPFVIEIDRRFIPPVPVMHREEITARCDTHKFNDALTVVGFKRLLFQVDKEIFQCFADVSIGKYIHVIFLESLDVFVFFRTSASEDDE